MLGITKETVATKKCEFLEECGFILDCKRTLEFKDGWNSIVNRWRNQANAYGKEFVWKQVSHLLTT